MYSRQIFLLFVALMAGVVGSASAAELPVDLACRVYGQPGTVIPATAKSGYIIWEYPPGDLYRHDPKTLTDIGGSGIDVTITCGYEGDTSMKVLGMEPVGETAPRGTPEGDPIANSWIISHRHWGNNPIDDERRLYWGSVYLRFYGEGLRRGRYRLKSYHNCPHNAAAPWWDVTVGNDVMSSIEVFGDGVQQLQGAKDVQIQHVTVDNELVPVEIEFEICGTYTSSNPVTVHFESPPGGDQMQGGAAVLNAFILYTASGGQASCPRPLDGAENVCPDVELSWGAGVYAAYHDVYLGTNFTDVSEATTSDSEVYMGQQGAEDTDYLPDVPLDLGQTYHWRIDEVNDACAPYLWKGVVWSFTTNDGRAYNPNPEDGAAGVLLDANLSWTPGCFATSHDVYFGTSFGDVNDANSILPVGDSIYKGNQALDANEYDPCGLAKGTVYYWRVDELGDSDTWKGQVWSFRGTVDPGLMVWYKFDETVGGTVTDYSGHDFHGWVRDASPDTWWPWGRYDGCIHFVREEHLIVPRETLGSIEKQITVCVWVNGESAPGDMPIFDAGDEGADGDFKLTGLVPNSAKDVIWRAGNDTNDVLVWKDAKPAGWMGSWHHFAFVKDETAGTMSIYYDGLPVESTTDANTASLAYIKRNQGGKMFTIGSLNDQEAGYEGRLDDFALYSRALSASEIAALARGGDVALAWGPSPFDGEAEVARDVVLEWKPGDYAVSHDVYFGTDWDDVNDANSLWPVGTSAYKGQQDPCEYAPPGNLGLTTTYYWRIDEVNEPNTWKGNIWKFTVARHIIVDDMESYDQIGNWIYGTWEDGYVNSSGSEVTLGKSPWDPVHYGEQSMIYTYNNGGGFWGDLDYYSEIERTFADPCDWTEAAVRILTLFFYGDPNNDINEQMYVGLEDDRGVSSYAQVDYGLYGEDMFDIKEEEWHQWDIALSDFGGVILTVVKKVYIGFGIRGNPNPGGTPGGSGVAYFDDIRLYPGKCIPWRAKPAYDFTDDCKVGLADLGEMADRWLRSDKFVDADEPNTAVVHYEFNETSGSTVYDSNAPYYNGEAKVEDGNSTEAFWETDGRFDGCIRFERQVEEYCIDMPTDAFTNNITNQITISVWVNWDDPDTMPYVTNQLFSMHGGPGDVYKRILGVETSWSANDYVKFWDGSESVTYKVKEVDWSGGWNHYAFVKNVDEEYLRIYLNCDLADESDSNTPMDFPADNAWIGVATYRPDEWHNEYTGLLDDFRVYDYALSEAEIGWLASGGTGYVPLVSVVNIYDEEAQGSKAVNFKDLAKLMPSWGEEQFWPE